MNIYLEMYKILYQAYADEIRNLWQRSVFLGAFMVLVWTGYGALQLKSLGKDFAFVSSHNLLSIGLCVVIIILSLLWIAMAKGSKFVQEAHERHIDDFIEKKDELRDLFCHLDKYETKLKKELSGDLLFCGVLKPYRYSPSKINIALGWLSLLTSFILLNVHLSLDTIKEKIIYVMSILQFQDFLCLFALSIIVLLIIIITIRLCVKGG